MVSGTFVKAGYFEMISNLEQSLKNRTKHPQGPARDIHLRLVDHMELGEAPPAQGSTEYPLKKDTLPHRRHAHRQVRPLQTTGPGQATQPSQQCPFPILLQIQQWFSTGADSGRAPSPSEVQGPFGNVCRGLLLS